jgi:hypothetical protein
MPARALALALAVCAGCAPREPTPADAFGAALAEARAKNALVLVHFRLPGRPLSDAMDAELGRSTAIQFPDLVQVRLDAADDVARYRTLVAGGARSGPGLATCVVEPDGEPLAVRCGYLEAPALAQFVAQAAALRADVAAARARTDAEGMLTLADLHARLGRADLAAEQLRTLHAGSGQPARSRASARLAKLAVDAGDLVAARGWLAATPRRGDLAPELALTEGRLLLAACEPARAREVLEAAAAAFPAHEELPALLFALAKARHETGAGADALATLDAIASRFPDSPVAAAARRQASRLRRGESIGCIPSDPP